MSFPFIDTAGSPYEVGFQHGRCAADQIRATFRRFCRYGIGDAGAREALNGRIETTLSNRWPEAMAEIRGIADGAGMDYAQIRDLNFAVELWSDTFLDASTARACTLLRVAGLQEPYAALLAKSVDQEEGDEAYMLIQRVQPADGYRFVHVTFAGSIGTDGGVNEQGLAEVNSALCTRACNLQGFPVFIMARRLLQHSANVAEAVRLAEACDAINYGANILLGDAGGDCAIVERSVTRQAVRRADGARTMYATNHSLAPELADLLTGSPKLLANSHERFARVAVTAERPPASLDEVQSLFCDHSQPGGICQHGEGGMHTVAGLVVSPLLRQLWVTHGSPCQNPFVSVSLERAG
jgi:isopenicillin-N N-acyltransferase-like protein